MARLELREHPISVIKQRRSSEAIEKPPVGVPFQDNDALMGKGEHEKPHQDKLDTQGEENRGAKEIRSFFIVSGRLWKMAGRRFGKRFWLFDGKGRGIERLRSLRF